MVTSTFGSKSQDIAQGVAIDGSGNIVVVGKTFGGSNTEFAITRLTSSGALDTTFGGGTGKVMTQFGTFNDSAAVACGDRLAPAESWLLEPPTQMGATERFRGRPPISSGRGTRPPASAAAAKSPTTSVLCRRRRSRRRRRRSLVIDKARAVSSVVGAPPSPAPAFSSKFALARYTTLAAQLLDSSFATGGEKTLAIGPTNSGAAGLAIDGSGRIVAAGFASNGSNDDFAVARFIGDMPPVITSNGGGATAAVSVAENTTAVTTVVATDPDPNTTFRYAISGGTDASAFTINPATGVLTFVSAPNFEAPTDSNGDNIYNVTVSVSDGYQAATQSIAVTVTNVNEPPVFSSGTALDPNFGVNGVQPTALPSALIVASQSGQNISVDSSGRFVVVGKTSGNNFALTRYLATGAIDTTFGTNGSVTTTIGSDSLAGQCVTIDSFGRILVGGFLNGNPTQFAIARYSATGTLDTTGWGSSGIQVTSVGTNAQIESMAINSAGQIIAVGQATVGGRLDIVLVRYTAGRPRFDLRNIRHRDGRPRLLVRRRQRHDRQLQQDRDRR